MVGLLSLRKKDTPPTRKPTHFSDIHNYPSIPYIPRSSTDHTQQPSPRRENPFARAPEGQAPSIYEKYARQVSTQPRTPTESWTRRVISNGPFESSQSTINLEDSALTPQASRHPLREALSSQPRPDSFVVTPPVPQSGHRGPVVPIVPSRNSSLESLSSTRFRTTSLLSNYSDASSAPLPQNPARRSTMRPSPLNPNPPTPDDGYETGASAPNTIKAYSRRRPQLRAQDILEETGEHPEESDTLHDLRETPARGVLAAFANIGPRNYSTTSIASKAKADKVLGLDPNAKLASFYLVSGVPKDISDWSFADPDATQGVAQMEDSMGFFWRPEVLGAAYSGPRSEKWLRNLNGRKSKSSSTKIENFACAGAIPPSGTNVPDAGPQGPAKLINKTIKYAHPRDVEVVNSTLAPPTTCHSFSFTIPKHDTLAAIARTRIDTRLDSSIHQLESNYSNIGIDDSMLESSASAQRNMSATTELTFYGVTLTTWTHADPAKVPILRSIKENRAKIKAGGMDILRSYLVKSNATDMSTEKLLSGKWRSSLPWGLSRQPSEADFTGSETEPGMSDSDFEGPGKRRTKHSKKSSLWSMTDDWPDETPPVFEDGGDNFWTPYAITLVSRHPIFDLLQDFLRLSWSMYYRHAKHHMGQMCRILNIDTPRPGEIFKLSVGDEGDEEVIIEAIMPGALDFERGIVKVDFQLWPLFQALDMDHILTCAEVALSNSGRVMFFSKHPSMLNIAVCTLKYIVELRGWDGVAMPMLHYRDATFLIEDPGPYILGITSECRYLVPIPHEVVIVDLDTNSLSCKSPPANVISSRNKHEKAKAKILAAFGPAFPLERGVPVEFKCSYPMGAFRNFNRFVHGPQRPNFLGERLRWPSWWKQTEIITAFDKVMHDKHKKPSLIQRLTKSGMGKHEAQLTVGEQLAKTMMRKRALHYVETRDDLERKVNKVNKRLQKLTVEGDEWKSRFVVFEKQAEILAVEAGELKNKIDREKREAKRLSNVANEQSKVNTDLEARLKQTEGAHAEAMRQLSDMHHSMQELEKEREDIMNALEEQINTALAKGLSIDEMSRPSTPSGSILSSPKSHFTRVRPSTRDSAQSTMSRMTIESQPLSVLGAVRGAPTRRHKHNFEGMSSTEIEQEKMMWERTDGIAQRIANIQQKLEMALNNVTGHSRSESMATVTDDDASTHEVDGDETITERKNSLGLQTENTPDMSSTPAMSSPDDHPASTIAQTELETPLASRKVSVESIAAENAHPESVDSSPSHELPPQSFDDFRSPSSLHVEVANSPEHQSTKEWTENNKGSDEVPLEDRRRMSATELGLIPRGVSLRIKRRSVGPESTGQIVIRKSRLGRTSSRGSEGSEEQAHEHGRITSDSTFGEDMIITPSTSHASNLASDLVQSSGERTKSYDEGEEGRGSRLSMISNSTVAFGRAL